MIMQISIVKFYMIIFLPVRYIYGKDPRFKDAIIPYFITYKAYC